MTLRQPKGIPVGGQFAQAQSPESSVQLGAESAHLETVNFPTRQTNTPIEHRTMSTSNRSAREIARLVTGGDMDLDQPYQRPSVWTEEQRVNLVRSWLTGIPIPAVIINTRGGNSAWEQGPERSLPGGFYYACVDGKQRIETAVVWFSGDLAVPASWFDPEWIDDAVAPHETDDGPYVTYLGLTLIGQRLMSNRAMLPVIEAGANSIAEEADLYLLVNTGGTEQTAGDLVNAATYASAAS